MIYPGYQETLNIVGCTWTGLAVAALFTAERGTAFRDELAHAYEVGLHGIVFENDEVPETMNALVDLASLNSRDMPTAPIVLERHKKLWRPKERAGMLRISDGTAHLLNECVQHPGFEQSSILPQYAGTVSMLQPRLPIGRIFGNKRN